MFSLGALGGGVVGGWFSQSNIPIMKHVAFITMCVYLANYAVRNWFLPAELDKHAVEGKKKIKKPKIFFIVGLLGVCGTVGEGSAGDWGAILSRDTFDASPFVSTLPFICFSAAMVIGRLFGDRLASKYGPMKLIVGGGLIAGVGLGGGLIVGGVGGVIFGWLALGIGLATVIPMLFSQAGEMAKTRFEGQFAASEGRGHGFWHRLLRLPGRPSNPGLLGRCHWPALGDAGSGWFGPDYGLGIQANPRL